MPHCLLQSHLCRASPSQTCLQPNPSLGRPGAATGRSLVSLICAVPSVSESTWIASAGCVSGFGFFSSPMLASVVVCSSVIFLAVVAILAIKFWRLHSKATRFLKCNCATISSNAANKVRKFGNYYLKCFRCSLPESDRVPRDVEEMRAKFSVSSF